MHKRDNQKKTLEYFILGTKISLSNPHFVLNEIKRYRYEVPNYMCLFGLYPLVKSFEDQELKEALNSSYLNPLHGKLVEVYLRLKGEKNIRSVDGVYLLDKLLREPVTHYFYGANHETLEKIRNKIESEYPEASICGYKEPPIVSLEEIKNNAQLKKDILEINESQPNIIWVGLGGIKQDLVMYHYAKYLDHSLMIGVGAVFDYFSGNLKLSSNTVKRSGFRWLHRLIQQPHLIKKKMEIAKILLSLPFKK